MPGLSHWQHPQFFGYFPSNGELSSVLGDYLSHGSRRPRPLLAVEPRAHRSRRGRDRLDAPDARPLRRMERRDSGHRFDLHAGRAALRARARHRFRTEPRRAAGRSAAAGRLHVGAQPQLGREGGAARRLRPRQRPPHRQRRAVRDAPRCAGRGDRAPICAAGRTPCAIVGTTGTTATTALDPDRGDRRASRASTASGCTSMPRWPAPPWSCPNAAGCGTASKAPIRWCSIRTSGSVRLSIARCTTCATPSTWSASCPPTRAICSPPPTTGEEPARLGHSARPPVPRAEAVVPDPRAGRRPGLQARLRRDMANAQWLADAIDATPQLARARAGAAADALRPARTRRAERRGARCAHAGWADRVNRSGAAYLTPAVLDGRWMVRVSIGALRPSARTSSALAIDACRGRVDVRTLPEKLRKINAHAEGAKLAKVNPCFLRRACRLCVRHCSFQDRPNPSRDREGARDPAAILPLIPSRSRLGFLQ